MFGSYVRNMPSIDSYGEALHHWNKVLPVRGRKDGQKPIAHRRGWSRRMRMLPDESIAFTLYNTDVVTWHPDNSFTLEGHETLSTGIFANVLTPANVSLDAQRGVIVFGMKEHRWRRWVRHSDGRILHNLDLRVVNCDTGHRLRFEEHDGRWQPAPGQELKPIDYYELDRDHARALNKEHRIGELRLWVRALTALGGEVPLPTGFEGMSSEQVYERLKEPSLGYEAARAGDFATAAAHLRRSYSWRNNGGAWARQERVTENSYRQMRMALYRDKGALHKKSQLVMTWPEWLTKVYNSRY